eukprot:m.224527 g.224527  ORF g.224527 m.224527 type:complete len:315 (-) comp54198_c0_seq2:286-1230(-)
MELQARTCQRGAHGQGFWLRQVEDRHVSVRIPAQHCSSLQGSGHSAGSETPERAPAQRLRRIVRVPCASLTLRCLTLSRLTPFRLLFCCSYFDRLGAFQNPSYVPNVQVPLASPVSSLSIQALTLGNVQDVLCSRVATTGISEFNFEMEGTNFRMLDVGGQRSERRKWIHCFEGITSITFIAAINGYDQVCFEDNATNRMFESLALWDQIVNYAIFEKVSMILFFNKMDLFEKKVHKSAIGEHFPAYPGYCSTAQIKDIPKPTQLDFGKAFFLALFQEKVAPNFQGVRFFLLISALACSRAWICCRRWCSCAFA